MFERDLPGENSTGFSQDATIGDLPLESCDTINGSWGYNAADQNFKSVRDLVHYFVRAAGRDANLLLNVGPRPDGTIDANSTQRLEQVGVWLKDYSSTVKGTRGGPIAPQDWGVSTQTARRHLPACARSPIGRRGRLDHVDRDRKTRRGIDPTVSHAEHRFRRVEMLPATLSSSSTARTTMDTVLVIPSRK